MNPGLRSLHLNAFRDEGVFCGALAVRIRDEVAAAPEPAGERVQVRREQKATITARV